MTRYTHERPDWPKLAWRSDALEEQLGYVRHRQGRLIGRMEALGLGEGMLIKAPSGGRSTNYALADVTQQTPRLP